MSKATLANALGVVSVAFADILTHVVKLHEQVDILRKLNCHKVLKTRLALFVGIELWSVKLVLPLGLSQLE